MLTEAIIQTSNPTSLKIDRVNPDEILILQSISNLSSLKVQQFMGDFAREGSYYQGRRGEKRNPVINLKMNPNYKLDIEVSDIREMIYRMFMEPSRDSDAVQVTLVDDRRPDRYFLGYTESIDTDQWTKDQTAQVSMLTTDAYLRSVVLSQGSNPMGWFTLPLAYEGSADTGLAMTVKVLKLTDRITIRNDTDTMEFSGSFVPGDIFTINTSIGERAVLKNGVDDMSSLAPASRWLQLKEQGNVLDAYGLVPKDGRAVITSYSYRAAWWGV